MTTELPIPLLRIENGDRTRLGEALRFLLDHGSILGSEGPNSDLYQWAYANRPWLTEICALLDLKLDWENEQRIVQAVPQSTSFLLRMRLDATLVILTLWYEFDSAVRDQGATPPIFLTTESLNDSLKTKFEPLRKAIPSPTRLIEILGLAQRKNLIRFTKASSTGQINIEILSTIKRVIPFQDIADWTRYKERLLTADKTGSTTEFEENEDAKN